MKGIHDMGQISKLAENAYETAVAHGWYDTPVSFGEEVVLCHSELSEALQEFRVGGFGTRKDKITEELADTVIRIFTLSSRHQLDIEVAILKKMEKNKDRPYRHGGKLL